MKRKRIRSPSKSEARARARKKAKRHDRALNVLASNLSLLQIKDLKKELLLAGPFLKPHLGGGEEETGDLIFVWKVPCSKTFEVVVVEFTFSPFRSTDYDFKRLDKTFFLLSLIWERWFDKLKIELKESYSLFFRPVSVSLAAGDWSVVEGKRRQIFP